MTNSDIQNAGKCQIYKCDLCDFKCYKHSNYTTHLSTRKHKIMTNSDCKMLKNAKEYKCLCGKKYKFRQGLSLHKKTCTFTEKLLTNKEENVTQNNNNEINSKSVGVEIDKEMLIQMLLKNQEVMEKMIEIMPMMGSHTTTNSNNTNTITNNTTNNNQFNIQMFLNDRCKNAMNLTDFIDTLPITAETYDSTIDNGLTKTITNMITNGLSQLDVLERPIHCTDASRKTLYVKEDNVWEKDNELVRILLGIRQIASKQRTLINKWKDTHDDWNSNDRMQSRFTSLICNSITDIENEEKETNKIISSISKSVYLDNNLKKQYLE